MITDWKCLDSYISYDERFSDHHFTYSFIAIVNQSKTGTMDQHYYLASNPIIQQPAGFNTGSTELNQIKFDEMSKVIHELQAQSAVIFANHDHRSHETHRLAQISGRFNYLPF